MLDVELTRETKALAIRMGCDEHLDRLRVRACFEAGYVLERRDAAGVVHLSNAFPLLALTPPAP